MSPDLLKSSLSAAVPLHAAEMAGMSVDDVLSKARTCGPAIQDAGELILFRGRQSGKTAAGFNAVAKAIACLAFMPGGVKLFGMHWEYFFDNDMVPKNPLTFKAGDKCPSNGVSI